MKRKFTEGKSQKANKYMNSYINTNNHRTVRKNKSLESGKNETLK